MRTINKIKIWFYFALIQGIFGLLLLYILYSTPSGQPPEHVPSVSVNHVSWKRADKPRKVGRTMSPRLREILNEGGEQNFLPPGAVAVTKRPDEEFVDKASVYTLFQKEGTRFILNNALICKDTEKRGNKKPNPLLLILVSSRRARSNLRNAIRNSYGSLMTYKGWDIRVVFLLGRGRKREEWEVIDHSQDMHILLAWEFEQFGDMILGPFREKGFDEYSVSTIYQHVMGIRWALRFCDRAKYIVKVNDDNFVDTLEIVNKAIGKMEMNEKSFYCSQRTQKTVARQGLDWNNKTTDDALQYCNGNGYLASMKTMKKLFMMLRRVPFHREDQDDFFVTGVLRKAYNDMKSKNSNNTNGNNTLEILHKEHIIGHENDQCEYTHHALHEPDRLIFHKFQFGMYVNEFWCHWKDAIEDKGLFINRLKRRFDLPGACI